MQHRLVHSVWALLTLLVTFTWAQGQTRRATIDNKIGCQAATNGTAGVIVPSIALWQGIVLILCFGCFALLVAIIHRVIRKYVYYDAHLLDTFFDGGGDVGAPLLACAVVIKYLWTSSLSQAMYSVQQHGLVGHFWYAAGGVVHLFLFAIVAAEIRIKAPGAKTYLQVIKSRYGTSAHVTVMVFAFISNILVSGMVMLEGTRLLTSLTINFSAEVCCIVLAIAVCFFTVVGGVGGGIYVAYFSCGLLFSIMLVLFTDVFYDPFSRLDGKAMTSDAMFKAISTCGKAADNDGYSVLTFLSRGGLINGVLIILSTFGTVYVDNTFWQTAAAGKPHHTVWGFLTGGLAWFAIPFSLAFALGMYYWSALSIPTGSHALTDNQALLGLMPAYVTQQLEGPAGDYLMFCFMMVATVTTASAQVLSASSIIIYDIYQTYITPFRAAGLPDGKEMSLRMQRAISL